MRKIFGIIVLALVAIAGQAQTYQPVNSYGFQWQRGKFDKALLIPLGTGSTLPSDSIRDGAIRWNPTAAAVQVWKTGVWVDISTGGSVVSLDSARRSNDTLFFRYSTGGELAVKLDYYSKHISDSLYAVTASNGLTKAGSDISLGGIFGNDGNDIAILGNNNSDLSLEGTSSTNYTTDASTSKLRVRGTGLYMEAVDRIGGNLSQMFFNQSGYTANTTSQIQFTVDNGKLNRVNISQDSINIISPIINLIGSLRAYNLQNNGTSDSVLYTDNFGLLKQKRLDISSVLGLTDTLLTRTDSNFVKRIMNVDTVSTIPLMQAYNGRAKLLFVSDVVRGGLFYLSTTGTADNGIIFTGAAGKKWIRSGTNDNSVNVQWYGAIPNDGLDDYAAFLAAVLISKDVYVPAGTFVINTTCPTVANQRIYGIGNKSILTTTGNIAIFGAGTGAIFENLQFLGTGKGGTTPYVSANSTQYGIRILSAQDVKVDNCYFKNLGGAGIYVNTSNTVPHKGNAINNCTTDSCFVGYYMAFRGEYVNITNSRAYGGDYGVIISAGNNSLVACGIVDNLTGVLINSDLQNDAHGLISACKINHNTDYAVVVDSTANSFLFEGNMMYFSDILLKNVRNSVRFLNNDFGSMDSFKIQTSTGVEFAGNTFTTNPKFLKNWNGVDNTGTLSGVTFFNNRYIGSAVPYAETIQVQNQLSNNLQVSNYLNLVGTTTGNSSVSYVQFTRSDGTRTGYQGDASQFNTDYFIAALNGADMRITGSVGDAPGASVPMKVMFDHNGHYMFGDTTIRYNAGFTARLQALGSIHGDSLLSGLGTSTPLARTHFAGTFRLDLGSDAKWDIPYRDSSTGNISRLPAGTVGQVLTTGFGGKPQWSSSSVATAGGVKDFYTNATAADTLYPFTIPSPYLTNNGDKIYFTYGGTFAATGATDHTVGVAIGGTVVASLSNGVTSGGKWTIEGNIIRVSNTVVRYVAKIFFDNTGVTTNLSFNTPGELTGLNLSSNGLRIGLSVGSPNTNVTATVGTITFISAAP